MGGQLGDSDGGGQWGILMEGAAGDSDGGGSRGF